VPRRSGRKRHERKSRHCAWGRKCEWDRCGRVPASGITRSGAHHSSGRGCACGGKHRGGMRGGMHRHSTHGSMGTLLRAKDPKVRRA